MQLVATILQSDRQFSECFLRTPDVQFRDRERNSHVGVFWAQLCCRRFNRIVAAAT